MTKLQDEYEIEVSTDKNGRERNTAVYRGEFFTINLDKTEFLRFRQTSVAYLSIITVLHVLAGFINNQGMRQFYVSLPYTIAFFPLLYLGMGIFHLPKTKLKFQSDEVRLSFDRMKTASISLLALLGVGIIGELVYLIGFSLPGKRNTEFLFFILEFLPFLLTYFLLRSRQRVVLTPLEREK